MATRAEESGERELTTTAAARRLGVSISQVYRYVDSGELPYRNTLPKKKRSGRRKHTYRFRMSDVEALRARQVSR